MLLGLEISPQSASAVLADADGAAQFALQVDFAPGAPPATQWIAAMEMCRNLLHRASIESGAVARLGIAFTAPVSPAGIVLKDPTHPGWQGYDLARGAREHLGIENVVAASRVVCESRGEARFGALRGQNDWLYLHLGAELESALCVGGTLVIGNGGAGDVGGQIIERDGALDAFGGRGTLRAYCGALAFESRARSYGLTFAKADAIWNAADANFAAQSLVEDFSSRLAQGLAGAVSLFEPAQICVGGAFGTAIWPRLQVVLESKLRDMAPPFAPEPVWVQAQLGDDAACLGALL
jgi:glucokinase